MNNFRKNIIIWLGVFILLLVIMNIIGNQYLNSQIEEISYSELINRLDKDEVRSLELYNRNVIGVSKNGLHFTSSGPNSDLFLMKLDNDYKGNNINIKLLPQTSKFGMFINLLLSYIPTLLFIGVWIFMMRQFNKGGGGFPFGKSKTKMNPEGGKKYTFADIAGAHAAKQEVLEIIDFLRDPSKYQNIGGRIPKGCLLVGPPGTGKTLLARSIAGEANVPFFYISGSDFVEIYVGMGASRVRELFEQAKKYSPCIIFIDEIDAVGRGRSKSNMGGNDEREQTLNQMLVEMDGFEVNEGIIIVAATNRPDVLDAALLRPGRFDRQINIALPNLKERKEIIHLHLSKVKYDNTVIALDIARQTTGLSGAELANLINEAALLAAKMNKNKIDSGDIEHAKDKIFMGAEQKTITMLPREKELTAYHEAGHALIALSSDVAHPIHKATIIPRGRALGAVIQIPEHDQISQSYEELQSMLAVMMGGRVAEALIYGDNKITSGAASDIQQATKYAQAMVMQWGMSNKLGPVQYHPNTLHTDGIPTSPDTSHLIDQEILHIINQAYARAEFILKNNVNVLHILAKELIDKEVLTGEEINQLIGDKILKINIATLNISENIDKNL